MENNTSKVKLGDGVVDVTKDAVNDRTKNLSQNLVNMFFDYLEQKMKDFSETIRQMKNNSEATQEIAKMWSDELYLKGYIPNRYVGLSDEMLIHNFHQEGYMDGLYARYVLAMVDQGIQEEIIIAVRDTLRPNLIRHTYEERAEFTDLLKDEKYRWIEKAK